MGLIPFLSHLSEVRLQTGLVLLQLHHHALLQSVCGLELFVRCAQFALDL